ncbi:TetR/AcrR family transcriptional regulator [Streptomyces sp. NPDC056987]|uniref:TetR/AcrR family transcriptional regulator n=1 Tax=Streptomyces sp. NPDC056987 TaxID=3345988 RepID=UPI00362AEEBB
MSRQPFHHGNLRAELLERAEAVLRERGVEKLSLRELARDAGVSHGAPRSHFIDRGALLDALAERGFDRLAKAVEAAVRTLPKDSRTDFGLLRAAGSAYLDFAAHNPDLAALMVAAKADDTSRPVHDAALRLFTTMTALVTTALSPRFNDRETAERLTLLLSATVQGICSLMTSGRISATQGDALLDDAIHVFIAGAVSNTP